VLDEVDAPLDDANIGRFLDMVQEFTDQSQFIIITHSKQTMARSNVLYGVTMQERGVSQLVSVKFDEPAPPQMELALTNAAVAEPEDENEESEDEGEDVAEAETAV
jgi:chromosome segregation protein